MQWDTAFSMSCSALTAFMKVEADRQGIRAVDRSSFVLGLLAVSSFKQEVMIY